MKSLAVHAGVTVVTLTLVACQTVHDREQTPASLTSGVLQASNAAMELDRLDQRKPLPLLPMMANHQKQSMREHLTVVQEVVAATAAGDFGHVAQAAQRMGYSEAMAQRCEHLGAGAAGFSEQALAFHHSADRIVAAAQRENLPAVLSALSETLATCTACHESYKQRVVDKLAE